MFSFVLYFSSFHASLTSIHTQEFSFTASKDSIFIVLHMNSFLKTRKATNKAWRRLLDAMTSAHISDAGGSKTKARLCCIREAASTCQHCAGSREYTTALFFFVYLYKFFSRILLPSMLFAPKNITNLLLAFAKIYISVLGIYFCSCALECRKKF